MKDQAAEATIAAVAQKITVAGGSTAVLGGLTANEIAAFTGALKYRLLGLPVIPRSRYFSEHDLGFESVRWMLNGLEAAA